MASEAAAPAGGGGGGGSEGLSLSRSDHHFLRTLPWEKKCSGDGSFSSLVAKTGTARRPSNDGSVTVQGSSSYLHGSSDDSQSLMVQLVGWDGEASMDLSGLVLPRHWEDSATPLDAARRRGSRRESQASSLHKSQLCVPLEESDSEDANTFADDEYGSYDSDGDFSDLSHSQDSHLAAPVAVEQDRKRVQFGLAHVREYRVILDAPATCSSQAIAGEARSLHRRRRRRQPSATPDAGACSLTLDWSHAPVDFVYPALALGYQSYFSNRPCGVVRDKRLRLCQLNDLSFAELRLQQSRAIARRAADLILESAAWPLRERPEHPDPEAADLPRGSRWAAGAARDGPPVNLRAASLVASWRREPRYSDLLERLAAPPAPAPSGKRPPLRRLLLDYVSLPRSGLAHCPL